MDDAGRVNPYEHLAFPGTGLLRLVVGERLGAIAGAQTNRLHAPLPNKHLSAELELYGILSSISATIEGSLPENTASWQVLIPSVNSIAKENVVTPPC
jgi:hypothetical protein